MTIVTERRHVMPGRVHSWPTPGVAGTFARTPGGRRRLFPGPAFFVKHALMRPDPSP